MKGFPFAETVVCIGLLLGLLIPLSRTVPPIASGPDSVSTSPLPPEDLIEGWLELRFSHPPRSAMFSQGDTLLWEGGSDTREDADVELNPSVQQVNLQVDWGEQADPPYVEWRLETEQHGTHKDGAWGRTGTNRFSWHVTWESVE